MLRALISGIRNLFTKRRASAEIDAEVESYIAAAVAHRVANGMPAEEAERQARREFGSTDAIGERVYASRWESLPDEVARDIRFGWRVLRRNMGFTTIVVVTLAVAIGATTAIFSIVNAALLRPLPLPNQEKLTFVWERDSDGLRSNVGFATFDDWRRLNHTFSHMSAISQWDPTLVGDAQSQTLEGLRMSAGTFNMLGARIELGRDFLPDEDVRGHHFEVILSHALWREMFHADASIVGKAINLNGTAYTVVGVLGAEFPPVFSSGRGRTHQIYAPLAYNTTLEWACRDCRHLRVIGRIVDGATQEEALAEMNQISNAQFQQYPKVYSAPGVLLTPAREYLVGDKRPVLVALLSAVGFVLLIACVNVANLLLSLAARRDHEFAMRTSLGARPTRIVRQLLTETCLLFVIGGSGGILLAIALVSVVERYARSFLPSVGSMQVDGRICLFALVLSLATAITFGLAPAMRVARTAPGSSLAGAGHTTQGRERERFRRWLVVCDIALAVVLLAGAGLMTKSFIRLLRVNPGFDVKHTLSFNVDLWGKPYEKEDRQAQFFADAIHAVEALPGVDAVGITSQLPLGGNMDRYGMHVLDKPRANPADDPSADRYSVSPNYFAAMRIPLVAGRLFSNADRRDTQPVMIVNETFARMIWPGENPIGKLVGMGAPNTKPKVVIGVVGDVLHEGLDAPHTMQAYLPYTQMTDSSVVFVVRGKVDPAALKIVAPEAVRQVDPLQPVTRVTMLREVVAKTMETRRFTTLLFVVFAAIAVLLACVGVYGVMAYAVAQRTQEIGIRMVLGAERRDVVAMVLARGMRSAVVGTIIGVAFAMALSRLLVGLLFAVRPADATVFFAVPVSMLAVTLVACFVPARRAAKVEPTVALRYE